MKKNIIIGLLAVMTLSSWIYAFSWKAEAEAQTQMLHDSSLQLERALEEARMQMEIAEQARIHSEAVMLDMVQSKETE